jgi:hypothetical protein
LHSGLGIGLIASVSLFQSPAAPLPSFNLSRAYGLALVLAVPAIVFAPSLGFDWVWDDHAQIADNLNVGHPSKLVTAWTQSVWSDNADIAQPRYYRPVFVLWLWFMRQFGADASTGHFFSVGLHLAATGAFWAFLRRYTGSRVVATAAALLFALHPSRSESVAWVSGAPDGLAALFGFGALFVLLRARPTLTAQGIRAPNPRGQVLAMGLFALALFAKETALIFLCFPALLALGGAPHRRLRPKIFDAIRVTMPWLCVALLYLMIRAQVIGEIAPVRIAVSDEQINPTTLLLLGTYLEHLLVPINLSISYPIGLVDDLTAANVRAAMLWVIGGGLIWTVLLCLRTRATPLLLMGVLFLLPVLRFSSLSLDSLFQDRYLYLPSACLLAAVAWMGVELHRWLMSKHLALNLSMIAAGVGLAMTSSYALGTNLAPWKDDQALWTRATEVNKNSSMAHFNLGVHLENSGDLDGAETRYARAASLERDRAIFHFRLAHMMAERRANQEARNHFLKAASLRPNDPMMLYEAARIEAAMGDPRHSLRLLTRALRLVDHGEPLGGGLTRTDVNFERRRVLRQLEAGAKPSAIPDNQGDASGDADPAAGGSAASAASSDDSTTSTSIP